MKHTLMVLNLKYFFDMDLSYKVLWVEDEDAWAASVENSLKEVIEEKYGLVYTKTIVDHDDDTINYRDYDLILMDFNLSDGEGGNTGDKIIQRIREIDVLTDVVFYSAKGPAFIKGKAATLGLEGVYFSDRDKDQFVDKVSKVVESTIRKIQDLSNLRGLVMAEVSELDIEMEDIIKSYYINDERMSVFHEHVTKKREDTIRKQLKGSQSCDKLCQLNWRNLKIDEIVTDSYQKMLAMHQIFKKVDPKNTLGHDGQFATLYNNEIIIQRNNLAHCKSFKDENGNEVLKTLKGDVIFTAETFKEIRVNIRKYRNLFHRLWSIMDK